MNNRSPTCPPRLVVAALLLYLLLVALGSILVPQPVFGTIFSEHGVLEWLSLLLWGALALVAFAALRPISCTSIAAPVVALFCAAREADLHQHFTGESAMKISYYHDSTWPLWERVLPALIVGPGFVCLVYLVFNGVRRIFFENGIRESWGRLVVLATSLLIGSKLVDRTPDWWQDVLRSDFPQAAFRTTKAFEESIECVVPAILIVAACQFWRAGTGSGESDQYETRPDDQSFRPQ